MKIAKEQITKSGLIGEDDYLYSHLVLHNEQIESCDFSVLQKISIMHKVDLISIKKEGEFSFLHATIEENSIKDIEKWGLYGGTGDLGEGVYVVNSNDCIGIESLKDYLIDAVGYKVNDIYLVKGIYKGKYIECVYGEGHRGYIVLKEAPVPVTQVERVNIEDFLLNY
ncbi:MAG: hypothetical protein ACOCQR_01550 [bacterium]